MPKRLRSCATLLPLLTATAVILAAAPLPSIQANQNRHPAGELHGQVLAVQLEIGQGIWRPESDDGVGLPVYAFGEAGHPLQNPGPLIRVPQGTEIRASLHNTLPDAVTVHGLAGPGNNQPSELRIPAGATDRVSFRANTPRLSSTGVLPMPLT